MAQVKKVGVITSYLDFDKNYGGVLQAYALSRQIEMLGYKPYVMPYVFESIPLDKRANNPLWRMARSIRDNMDPHRRSVKQQKKMNRIMMSFVDRTLPVYKSSRISLDELSKEAERFYAFVSGSDQVWNTRNQNNHCDPGMFLKFVPKGVGRIAYAPSLGSAVELTADTAGEFRTALNDYDAVSVREKSGRDTIKAISGKDVPIVLDPTLLLEENEWRKIEETPDNLPNDYILIYRFGEIPSNYKNMVEIQKHLNIPIVELPSSSISMKDDLPKRFDIDPGKFIGLIRHARLVCTDSFHATVFSILTQTPFVSFYRQNPQEKNNMNGRVDDLLELTGLHARLTGVGEKVDLSRLFEIDFTEAIERINAERQSSLDFLKDSLQKIGERKNEE